MEPRNFLRRAVYVQSNHHIYITSIFFWSSSLRLLCNNNTLHIWSHWSFHMSFGDLDYQCSSFHSSFLFLYLPVISISIWQVLLLPSKFILNRKMARPAIFLLLRARRSRNRPITIHYIPSALTIPLVLLIMCKSRVEEGWAFIIISLGLFLRTMTDVNDRNQLSFKSVSRYWQ